VVGPGIGGQCHVELPDQGRDLRVRQPPCEYNAAREPPFPQVALQLAAQRTVSGDHQAQVRLSLGQPLQQRWQDLYPVPGSQASDEPQNTIVVQPPTLPDLRVGFARLEQSGIYPVGNDVHPIRLCSERDRVVAQWGRDGEHSVGARERPALRPRGQIPEPGSPVGSLL
jgi:hypothetical protein